MTDRTHLGTVPVTPEDQPSSTAPALRKDPGQFVCCWRPLSWATVAGSILVCGGGYWLAKDRIETIIIYLLVCVTLGLIMTLAAAAWGSMIALTESARAGLLFILFPPYMFYYAATRWRWMSQPSVLFICGIAVTIVPMIAAQGLLNQMRS